MGFHPCQDLFTLERLRNLVQPFCCKIFALSSCLIAVSDENDWKALCSGILFKPPANFTPIDIRQPDMEQNQIGGILLAKLYCRLAVECAPDLVSLLGQKGLHGLPSRQVIIYNEQAPFVLLG